MAKIRGSLRLALLAGLLVMFSGILGVSGAQADLFVGNFFGPGNEDVLRYNGTTGAFVSTFVPTGSGGLTFPLGGAFGPDGNFYVSNSDTDAVLRYNGTTGAFINTFATVEDAAGLVFRGGFLHVADASAGGPPPEGAVFRFNATTGAPDPAVQPFVAHGSGGLTAPEGIAFGPDGNLYASSGNTILKFNGTSGAFISTFVAAGTLTNARGVTFGPDGNLYVANFGGGTVDRFNGTTGAFVDHFVKAGDGGLSSLPRPLVFGPDGNLYVGDFGDGDVLRFNGTTGAFINTFVATGSGGLGGPTFLVFDGGVPIPLPGSLLLLGSGLLGLGGWRRFRKG